MKELYERLAKERTKKGLNYEQMAKKVGISKSFYWQIEHKKRRLYYVMAKKIALILGLKPDDLFYEESDIISRESK